MILAIGFVLMFVSCVFWAWVICPDTKSIGGAVLLSTLSHILFFLISIVCYINESARIVFGLSFGFTLVLEIGKVLVKWLISLERRGEKKSDE